MKRVMVVLPELETGGGQRIALEIVRNIKREDATIRVLSLYPRRGTILEELADKEGLDVRYLDKKPGFSPGIGVQIYREIRAFKPDVIHAHLRVMPYLLAPMCLCRVPRRYYTVHSLAEHDAQGVKRKILKFAFHFCHVVPVAISPACQRSISALYALPLARIPLIDQGIDVKKFTRPDRYGRLDAEQIRIVAVGRMAPVKNYALMLDAFKELHMKYPHTRLCILGDGELRGELQTQVKQLGLEDCVSMPGITDQVNVALWNAHIYLMTSDVEGLPLAILEAMAAGLPIVSTRAGGVVDVVSDGENGLLVDCGNKEGLVHALQRLVEDGTLREQFSARSEQMAQEHSIEVQAEKHLRLYFN